MRDTESFGKTRTILSMILAPLLYFLMGQMVVISAAVLYTTQLAARGYREAELSVKVTELVFHNNILLTAIAALLTLPVVFFVFYKRETVYTVNKGKLFWTIPFGIAVCVTVNMLLAITRIPEYFPAYDELAESIYQGNIWFELVGVALLPALLEELIYRGVLYKGFRRFFPFLWANLFSSLVFGAMHMNMVQFVYAFCLGFLFAWVYERYQNLWAPILMHMAANAFSVLMTEWKPLTDFLSTAAGSMTMLLFLLLGDTLLPLVILKTVHAQKKTVPAEENTDVELSM